MTPDSAYLVISGVALSLLAAWGWALYRTARSLWAWLPEIEPSQRMSPIRRWAVASALGLWVPLQLVLGAMWMLLEPYGRRSEATLSFLCGSAVALPMALATTWYLAVHIVRFQSQHHLPKGEPSQCDASAIIRPSFGALVGWILKLGALALLLALALVALQLGSQAVAVIVAVVYGAGTLVGYLWQGTTSYRIRSAGVVSQGPAVPNGVVALGPSMEVRVRNGLLGRALGYADILLLRDGRLVLRLRGVGEPDSAARLLKSLVERADSATGS